MIIITTCGVEFGTGTGEDWYLVFCDLLHDGCELTQFIPGDPEDLCPECHGDTENPGYWCDECAFYETYGDDDNY